MPELHGIEVSPSDSPVDFGTVAVGEVSTIQFTMEGIASIVFIPQVTAIAIVQQSGQPAPSGEFSLSGLPSFPANVIQGSPVTFNVLFTPADAGAENVDLLISNNTPDPEIRIPLLGTGLTPTGSIKAISANPPNLLFDDVKVGVAAPELTTVITNVGDTNVSITGLTLDPEFALTTGSFPQTITPGNTYTLGITFTPSAAGVKNFNATLAGDMDAGSYTINLIGTAFQITPAYTLSDAPPEVLTALFDGTTATVRQFDHTDLDCEENAYIEKTHMYPFYGAEGIPFPSTGQNKQVMRVGVHYKDLGAVTAKAILTAENRADTDEQEVAFGTVGADGKIKWVWFDAQLVDELVRLRLERDADNGPLEISDYLMAYEPKGEMIKP